jgi:hypothetical protein
VTAHLGSESSQINNLPKAKSKTRSKQNKDMRREENGSSAPYSSKNFISDFEPNRLPPRNKKTAISR